MQVQYYDGRRRNNPETQAIKRLMFAVLADAMRCFQTYADAQSRAGRRIFGEAQWWILDRNSDGPFTFEAICETLGIEPDRLRNGLHQWRVQQSGGMNPRRLGRGTNVRNEGQISSPQRPQPRRRKGDIGGERRDGLRRSSLMPLGAITPMNIPRRAVSSTGITLCPLLHLTARPTLPANFKSSF